MRKIGASVLGVAAGLALLMPRWTAATPAASGTPGASATATPTATASAPPIVVIVMENHSYGPDDPGVSGDPTKYIVGNPDAPYINGTLIPHGTLFTNVYATQHPSLPNYLDMTAGTTAGCANDACPPDAIGADNLFHQLGEAGVPFATFAESMPANCATSDASPYVVHHNPEAYFTNVDAASGLGYACPITDVPFPGSWPDPLPAFSFVVPDNDHNMHSTDVRTGDAWLSATVPSFEALGAVVIVTFDEAIKSDRTNGGGHILTVMVGPDVPAGTTDGTAYSHFSLLAGLEDHFGIPRLGGATTATPLPIPPASPAPTPSVSPTPAASATPSSTPTSLARSTER